MQCSRISNALKVVKNPEKSPLLSRSRMLRCSSDASVITHAMADAAGTSKAEAARYVINEIPSSRWKDGIPAVMGAHLMASGNVAPISTSTGPGIGLVPHMFQYHTKDMDTQVYQFADFNAASRGMVAQVVSLAAEAIQEKGAFTLAISGGSMLKALEHFRGAPGVDFSKWWIFFVDERNVPHSSDESTYGAAKAPFIESCGIPAEQVLEIHEGMTAQQAATNYEGRMLDVDASILPRCGGKPVLDCILLGTGPDGHIASLFPNSASLSAQEGWVIPVTNSPKPPSERITFTLPVINAAKACIFLATGAGKAEIVQRILECQALPGAVPAQLVRPVNGTLAWFLDIESSAGLEIASWEDKKAHPRSQM
jgi:6-phosphogluconolactonase